MLGKIKNEETYCRCKANPELENKSYIQLDSV